MGRCGLKLTKQLANLYDIEIIGVSNVGEIRAGSWAGQNCIGNSIAVGPKRDYNSPRTFGVSAECLMEIAVPIIPRLVKGTAWAGELRKHQYNGS